MKKLMLGNEAIARGLYEAGCEFVSSYPGTPSTEITEEVAKYKEVYAEWAPNEKVAMESAFGASFGGRRSFCGMKQVGLNVAADPLFTISYTGLNAGMVIGVADDPGMHSSQNEQDSRHYAIAAKVPMLEPSDSNEALNWTKRAFEISEEYDTPVFIKMCTRIAHSKSIVETSERKIKDIPEYIKRVEKYVMVPGFAKLRHPIIEERLKKLVNLSETDEFNIIEKGEKDDIGFITSSASYQYVKEVYGDTYSILKLGLINPMPIDKIKKFSKMVKKVIVVEELDPIIETHCKNIGIECYGKDIFTNIGEFTQNIVAKSMKIDVYEGKKISDNIPNRPPVLCPGCPHRGIFYILHKNNLVVFGDIGCYTLGSAKPLLGMDYTICMGASVSGIHGYNKLGAKNKAVAVIGDSTFIHSGITGLINGIYNNSNSTIIILDNSITGMTGHQQNPTTGYNLKGDPAAKVNLEELCKSIGVNRVRVIDPYDIKESEKVIMEEVNIDEPSVIISRRPCVLLKYVKHNPPITCDIDKCVGCKSCMKIGCPAISIVDNKAHIDTSLCVGCKVCISLCPTSSLVEKEAK